MFIANIEYPGTWIQLQDNNKKIEISNLISSMENVIVDLAITLSMFHDSRERLHEKNNSNTTQETREKDRNLKMQIEEEYRKSLPDQHEYYANYDLHRLETEKRFRDLKISQGAIPNSYKNRFSFIHAHSFLLAADTFSKFLNVLVEETNDNNIELIKIEFETQLPALRKVRNSAQHIEDRSRGYGKPADVKKKQKMDLKPIDIQGFIKSNDGGVLVMSSLNGNRLGYTIDDGSYQEFEISLETLSFIVGIFQKIINSFTWQGPAQIKPSL